MLKYDLTYDDAKEICNHYDNFNFSEHKYRIRGFKISTFDYFICGYNHFNNPLPNKPDVKAFEMRGLTFVFNKDGSIWNKFLMLPKFFNLNEIEETQYHKLKHKNIKHISIKEDGSLVAFMLTPDEEIFAKTIRGFSNEQVEASLKLLNENPKHKIWVKNILKFGFTPLFEYVSWKNRIVLKYSQSELRLIGLRNNNNGDFIPASQVKEYADAQVEAMDFGDIKFVPSIYSTLEELIEKAKVEENKEGWVVIFDDDSMIKIKTSWYFNIHGLRTENIFREDYIIKNYYEKTLDDIKAQLNPNEDKDAFLFIDKVIKAIDNYSHYIDENVKKLFNIWHHSFNGNWDLFATNHYKDKFFKFVKFYDDKEKYNNKKIDHILKLTYKLQRARQIVETYGTSN